MSISMKSTMERTMGFQDELRHREGKRIAQRHPAFKRKGQGLNPSNGYRTHILITSSAAPQRASAPIPGMDLKVPISKARGPHIAPSLPLTGPSTLMMEKQQPRNTWKLTFVLWNLSITETLRLFQSRALRLLPTGGGALERGKLS